MAWDSSAKRLEHIPNSDPPRVWVITDNPLYKPYEGSGEEVEHHRTNTLVCAEM